MAKNELLPFANGEDANILNTSQWEALTDIVENGFQSGIARSEQVNRVLAQGAIASYVLGQLIVDELSQDATLDKDTLYQRLVKALQENAKDACLPLAGGTMTGDIAITNGKNIKNTVDTGWTRLLGGTALETGGRIQMAGKCCSGYEGQVWIVPNNGTSAPALKLLSDGSATWNGKNLVRSVNGSTANADGSVTVGVANTNLTYATKLNQQVTCSVDENIRTLTITGLTVGKVAYLTMNLVSFASTSNSMWVFYPAFMSGVCNHTVSADGSSWGGNSFSFYPSGANATNPKMQYSCLPFIPTSTTVVIKVKESCMHSSLKNITVKYIVYQ